MKRVALAILLVLGFATNVWAPPGGAGFAYPTFYLDTDNYYKPFDSSMGIAVGGTAITLDADGTVSIGSTLTLVGGLVASGIAGTADWYVKLAADGTASIGDPSGGTVNSFKTWAYAGTTIVADSTTDTVTIVAGSGMSIAMSPTADSITLTSTAGGGANLFETIAGDAGTNPVADSATDTLNITGGSGVTTTGDSSTDTIDITVDHDAITNFVAGEHFTQANITTVGTVTVGDVDSVVSNADSVTTGKIEVATIAETNTGTSQTLAVSPDGLTDWTGSTNVTTLGTIATGTWNGTDIPVSAGGTGASTLTDGGVLLGSGTGAVTSMNVLADGELIVGDGTTDPVAESGATLRTSIGVAIGSDVQAYSANMDTDSTDDYTVGGTDVPVTDGGTGVSTLTDGGVLLGSGTGAVTPMAVLADSAMIVGDGTTDPVAESGATLRTSIGVGSGDSPQFTGVEVGAATDTTLSRKSAGVLQVEANELYVQGGTDVALADGGTGASTAAAARAALEAPPPMEAFVMAGSSLTTTTYPLIKTSVAITITDIHCITDTGTVIMELEEGTATAYDGGTVVDSTITCDSNGAEDDGTLTNGTIAANAWIAARIGTEASSPTILGVTFYYTVD